MNCTAFEAWLDEGLPPAAEREALAHAGTCAGCAAALASARAVEAALVESLGDAPSAIAADRAPAGFAAAVIARIADAESVQVGASASVRAPVFLPAPVLAWWVRAAAQPAPALALALAALLLWRAHDLVALGSAATQALISGAAASALPGPPGGTDFGRPDVQFGLVLALAPALAWLAARLFSAGERFVAPTLRRPR
jgi:hypothetical protein